MTNLGLKTLNVVPCYCHHNVMGGSEYHQRQYLPRYVAHQWLTHVLVETFLPTMLLYGMWLRYLSRYGHGIVADVLRVRARVSLKTRHIEALVHAKCVLVPDSSVGVL
ncbi:hypothetical protein TNCV_3961501 [Trichonephila clavipes]|nr:hypothetical protein TNCV_3961501 [Trichonephila clavipes]